MKWYCVTKSLTKTRLLTILQLTKSRFHCIYDVISFLQHNTQRQSYCFTIFDPFQFFFAHAWQYTTQFCRPTQCATHLNFFLWENAKYYEKRATHTISDVTKYKISQLFQCAMSAMSKNVIFGGFFRKKCKILSFQYEEHLPRNPKTLLTQNRPT